MTDQQIRDCFPHQKAGVIHLNHAAISPWSTYVTERIQALTRNQSETAGEDLHHMFDMLDDTRTMVAEMINAPSDRIAFVQNTSEGINILANGLPWQAGDRVALVEMEFPANIYPYLNLRRRGVEIDFIPQVNGVISMDDIERALTPRTKLLAISWVQFLSGFRIDLKQVWDVCSARNVLLAVDAIQGLGAIRLNLAETPVDFLAAGGLKWQMGPSGFGMLYISQSTQDRIRQAHLSWLQVKNAWDFFDYRLDLRDEAARYETSNFNLLGLYGYNGALHLFKDVGYDEVQRRVVRNAAHAYEQARERGFEVLTPEDPVRRAGIVSFSHERSEEIYAALIQRNVVLSARGGHIRLAPHFYNTEDEIAEVLEAIYTLPV